MKYIPNLLSISRIILSIVLLNISPLSVQFILIYIICVLSDIMDGIIARGTGTSSRFGERIDSISDLIMLIILIYIFYPIVNPGSEIVIWMALIGCIRLISILIVVRKYKTFAILHTYSNKITGIALFMFPLSLSSTVISILSYIICILASISAVEELVIHLTSNVLQVNRTSIFSK